LSRNIESSTIEFGQVWKAIRDYKITIYSHQKGCVIPKDTRVVVLNTPMPEAIGFNIMPLTSKSLDERLVPNLERMELRKEGFGVTVTIEYFKRHFILDGNQKIEFDSTDASLLWNQLINDKTRK